VSHLRSRSLEVDFPKKTTTPAELEEQHEKQAKRRDGLIAG